MGGFFNRFDASKTSVTATVVTADDLEIDSGTLSIDATNNRVGIGLTNPAATLSVAHADDTEDAVTITGDSLTTGSLLKLISNSASSGNRTLLSVHNDHASAVGVQMVHLKNSAVGADGDPILLVESAVAETEAIIEVRNSHTATDKPPTLKLNRASWADADDMGIGNIVFQGVNDHGSSPNKIAYASIVATATDTTEDNEDESGKITFNVFAGGTAGTAASTNLFSIGGEEVAGGAQCEVVVNDAGINCDFRVEGDTNTHMLFVDGENDLVIIDRQDATTSTHDASFIVDGPTAAIAMKEMAAAPSTDIATFGQIWVKDTGDGELYFTTDAGDDIQLTSGTAVAGGGGADANDLDHILHQQVFS